MAKASPDADHEEKTCSEDLADFDFGLPNGQTPLQYYLRIGNLSHIKHTNSWKKPEIYKNTYFILPVASDGDQLIFESIWMGGAQMDIGDFVIFWHELSDNHKVRRLMLNYLCAIRGIEDIYNEMGISGRDDMKVLQDMISAYTSIFRQLFIKEQHRDDPKKLEEIMSVFIQANIATQKNGKWKLDGVSEMFTYFSTPLADAVSILMKQCGCSSNSCLQSINDIVNKITSDYLKAIIRGLIYLYTNWASFDVDKVVGYAENQRVLNKESAGRICVAKSGKLEIPKEGDRKRFMSKVSAQVPHWNKNDRAKILGIIDKPGAGPKDYMGKLMEEVGMEKFKILALGKEYLCAACNRSSYIGDDRLWACPQCHWECTRPMARYCNEDCQKADWIKHKSEFHSVDICNACKKKEEPGKKLRRCMRCVKENVPNPAVYCDEVCQKQDWAKHKEDKHSKKGA